MINDKKMIEVKKNPIVVIGMHRSGTSMLTRVLEECGIFWGAKKEENNESIFFANINRRMLQAANATWDRPDNLKFCDSFYNNEVKNYITNKLKSVQAIEYWGKNKYLLYNFNSFNNLWGWKDPRTTLFMDIWKNIFPNMKIIHIYRHPLDVANSLSARQKKFEKLYNPYGKMKTFAVKNLNLGPRKLNLGSTYRCLEVIEGFKLWEYYTLKAYKEEHQIIHIKYEDLLIDSKKELRKISDFLEINININSIIKDFDFNPKRAFAFESTNITEEEQDWLNKNMLFNKLYSEKSF